jgi:hypothetical protein
MAYVPNVFPVAHVLCDDEEYHHPPLARVDKVTCIKFIQYLISNR